MQVFLNLRKLDAAMFTDSTSGQCIEKMMFSDRKYVRKHKKTDTS